MHSYQESAQVFSNAAPQLALLATKPNLLAEDHTGSCTASSKRALRQAIRAAGTSTANSVVPGLGVFVGTEQIEIPHEYRFISRY